MRKKFSAEKVVRRLNRADKGLLVAELTRKAGITEQTYYHWKLKYARLEVDQVCHVKQLREEDTK